MRPQKVPLTFKYGQNRKAIKNPEIGYCAFTCVKKTSSHLNDSRMTENLVSLCCTYTCTEISLLVKSYRKHTSLFLRCGTTSTEVLVCCRYTHNCNFPSNKSQNTQRTNHKFSDAHFPISSSHYTRILSYDFSRRRRPRNLENGGEKRNNRVYI